ncbi:NhaA family Na+:H+ antiporter [Pontibacter aydingkolensis]|uniref:Na(+)/H(+) antiporter NhaA n=1 Tax=Pontibacter aydingkolensis TaxID=1911536 RepID=A0ABS7CXC8_9BACT|nr:Na+/H+ antiporter NhaA [Pontibacter aydingkolensis]MBW7468531.1 Na+/H+ antiporter NhaA [Pontibacter aydingkolensis]
MPKTTLFRRIAYPLQEFLRTEAFSGILLMVITLVALAWANSPWGESYIETWNTVLTLQLGEFGISKAAILWINDGLMAIFFFVVGLEIKRETMVGELSNFRSAAFPVMAAIGGMVVPAGIFVLLNQGLPSIDGWGIPMATDIAFAIGILSLLGKRVPLSLKLFLVAYAIVDDIGAVLVIALFYTSELSILSILIALLVFGFLLILNGLKVRNILIYSIFGLIMWVAFLKSGVHATVAGILLAVTIPGRSKITEGDFISSTDTILGELHARHTAKMPPAETYAEEDFQAAVRTIESNCEEVGAPMYRLEHALHPWVAFAIMPIFALANAGIVINSELTDGFSNPLTWGIILGLVVGKPVGIVIFAVLASVSRIARKPTAYTWTQLIGVSFVGGVGFTMAIFIANLAYAGSEFLPQSKLAILCASLIAGLFGYFILRFGGKKVPDENV